MIVAAAQTQPQEGNLEANIAEHIKWASLAAQRNAQLILFPELSLTGYTREKAKEWALIPGDVQLTPLKEFAAKHSIYLIAGAPVLVDEQLYIGACIFQPNASIVIYTKQYLHAGEELYYASSFNYNPVLEIGGERISMAICADIDRPEHALAASQKNTTLYLVCQLLNSFTYFNALFPFCYVKYFRRS